MIRQHGNTVCIHQLDFSEFRRALDLQPHPSNASRRHDWFHNGYSGNAWIGGLRSKEDAYDLLDNGWKTGVDKLVKVKELIGNSVPTLPTKRRVRMVRDQGDELRIDQAMAGDWEQAWHASERQLKQGSVLIDLWSLYGDSAGSSTDQLFWKGATAAIMVDMLEQAGYQVRLHASFLHSKSRYNPQDLGVNDIIVKDYQDPIAFDQIAAVLCHAGIYRTLGFHSWLHSPHALASGLGLAIYQWSKENIAVMKACGEMPEESLIIEKTCYNQEAVIAQVKEMCARTLQLP